MLSLGPSPRQGAPQVVQGDAVGGCEILSGKAAGEVVGLVLGADALEEVEACHGAIVADGEGVEVGDRIEVLVLLRFENCAAMKKGAGSARLRHSHKYRIRQ